MVQALGATAHAEAISARAQSHNESTEKFSRVPFINGLAGHTPAVASQLPGSR
jgi:hypothetical protein